MSGEERAVEEYSSSVLTSEDQEPLHHVFDTHAIRADPPPRDPKNVTLAYDRLTFPVIVKHLDDQIKNPDPIVITQILLYSARLLPQGKNVYTATEANLHGQLAKLIAEHGEVGITTRNSQQIAECLMLMCKQAVGRKAMEESIATLNALKTLNCFSDTTVRQLSMHAFVHLCSTHGGAFALVENHFISHFSERARDERDLKTKELSLNAIYNCCRQHPEEASRQSFDSQVVDTAVGILKDYSKNNDGVILNAIKVIHALGERFENKEGVIDKGGVTALLDALSNANLSLETKGRLCGALTVLATEKDGKIEMLEYGMENFVGILEQACQESSASMSGVVLNTVQLLNTLGSYPAVRQACHDLNVMKYLPTLENAFSHNKQIATALKTCKKCLLAE